MGSINKILIVRASGGLSNRLQAVICGIGYCLLTGRSICVDWRDGLYSDDFTNVFPLWFNIVGLDSIIYNDALKIYENKKSIKPDFWHDWLTEAVAVEYLFENNEHMQQSNIDKTSIRLENFEIDEDIAVLWAWDTSPLALIIPKLKEKFHYLKQFSQSQIESYLLKKHIKPTVSIKQEAEDFFKLHFDKPPIGIHIRHTDLQSPLPLMLEKLNEVAANGENIFLCTDNKQVETMIRRIFPHTVVREKIYQGSNIPLHSYVEGISNVAKGRDAILDMLILAKCEHIIHFKQSSFARIPILYSNLNVEQVHIVS